MKITTSLILFFTLCASLQAQRAFHSSYDFNNDGDFGFEVIEVIDKGFFVSGQINSSGSSMSFLKIDSNGITQFHKRYKYSNDVLTGGGVWENGYYGFGSHYDTLENASDIQFIFLNQNGDSIKTINYDLGFNDRIIDALLLQDSTFMVLGFSDTAVVGVRPFIAHIDTLGTILWQKWHDVSNIQETVTNIQATPDGGYIIGGVEEESPAFHTDLFLLKVDSAGNQQWKYKYHEPLSQRTGHVEVLQDGNYALFGTGYHPQGAQRAILKIDSAGTLIFRQKHGVINLDEGYIVGKELPNGNFICAGTSIRMYNGQAIDDINLSMLDSAGNQLWSRDYSRFGMDVNQYVKDLKVTSDGGFVVTGFILNAPGGTGNDIFILKTDENGILTGLNSGFTEVEKEIQVYPNPTTGRINIPLLPTMKEVEVFDLQGRRVSFVTQSGVEVSTNGDRSLQAAKQSSEEETINADRLSRSSLAMTINGKPGIYLLKITMQNGSVRTSKIIKQ